MGKTKNINILKDRNTEYIYCGRGRGEKNDPRKCKVGESGWLGNPIAVGKVCFICKKVHSEGGTTLPCYEKYLEDRLVNDEEFSVAFYEELMGQTLGCFCKPKPCHTDIMIKHLDVTLSLSKEQIDKILKEAEDEDPFSF